MKKIELIKFGTMITSNTIGTDIYNLIKQNLNTEDEIEIDISGVKSMATFCAKQIFGALYIDLGSSNFFKRIIITGADEDLKTIIEIGIQNAIEDNERK